MTRLHEKLILMIIFWSYIECGLPDEHGIKIGDCRREANTDEVSNKKGFSDVLDATKVDIEPVIVYDKDKRKNLIYMTCSSCRVPNENHVEFQINNKTKDTITFDPSTNSCYSSAKEDLCDQEVCNCSKTGKAFMRAFEHRENALYSCDMVFKDDIYGTKFSKIVSAYVNETGIFTLPVSTIVLKWPDKGWPKYTVYSVTTTKSIESAKTPQENEGFPLTAGIILPFVVPVFAVVWHLCKFIYARIKMQNNERRMLDAESDNSLI